MRHTRFTDYSLRVLIYLGQNSEDRVTINQISEAYDISKNHLMKVVSNLTRMKLVIAQRGPGGGIRLNRSPQDIALNEVIQNTEKHFHGLNDDIESSLTGQTPDARLSNFLDHALRTYLEALSQFTLEDVLQPGSKTNHLIEVNRA